MVHNADMASTSFWNCFYDYTVSDSNHTNHFDYSYFPDNYKIHRNKYLTQLIAGHAKIDLIAEDRQKKVIGISTPVLLIYTSHITYICAIQRISYNKFIDIWYDIASSFLAWCQNGIVVFRPRDNNNWVVRKIKELFINDGRFIVDEGDDNKFWISRAQYFVTDLSRSYIISAWLLKGPPSA